MQKSDDEEKKCCPSNRDDDTMPICAPLSQNSDKMCGSMEFADIDKDILTIDYNNDFERLMSTLSPAAIEQKEEGRNKAEQGTDGPKKFHYKQPDVGGGRRKTRRKKRKRKRQTRCKRKNK